MGLAGSAPGLAYALGLAGLSRITASASSLLWAIEPVLIVLLAWAMLGQRPSASLVTCGALALAGVLLVVVQPGVRADATGILLVLAGVSACAVYTVASSRYLGHEPTHGVVVVQQLSALAFALVLFAGAGVAGGLEPLDGVSATAWASAVSSGTLYYGVASGSTSTGGGGAPRQSRACSSTWCPCSA